MKSKFASSNKIIYNSLLLLIIIHSIILFFVSKQEIILRLWDIIVLSIVLVLFETKLNLFTIKRALFIAPVPFINP